MNYTEIVDMALSYSDREDDEVTTRMDNFIEIAESRINKKLKVASMSARATIDLALADVDQEIFALPVDFGGLRSIKLTGEPERTFTYVNPEQLSNRKSSDSSFGANQRIYYNLVAKELHIFPPANEGDMTITYYQKVPPLTSGEPNNWISDDSPECYIFAILVEITSFAKDADAMAIWAGRFSESIDDLEIDDSRTRWSGTPLQIHLG